MIEDGKSLTGRRHNAGRHRSYYEDWVREIKLGKKSVGEGWASGGLRLRGGGVAGLTDDRAP